MYTIINKIFPRKQLQILCAFFLVINFYNTAIGLNLDNIQVNSSNRNTTVTTTSNAQAGSGSANNNNPVAANAETQVNPALPIRPKNPVKVIAVYNLRVKNGSTADSNKAGIEDIIVVKVKGLKWLVNEAKCLDDKDSLIPGCSKQEIRLFIDGRMIKDIAPESGAPQPEDGEMQFHLQRNTQNNEAWADILGGPRFGDYFFEQPVKVSVGLENKYPVDSQVEKFNLVRLQRTWFWGCLIGFILYLFILYRLATKSEILRDRIIDASAVGIAKPKEPAPYSLGRFQMAFWFSVVVVSFLLIWLITGAYEISAGVLGLLGIGAGTALGAAVIDDNKSEGILKETINLEAQAQVLRDELTQLKTDGAVVPPPINITDLQSSINLKSIELNKTQMQINQHKINLTPLISKGFLKDILNDINGVSFHRYQMLVWTVVLGLIFVYTVWHKLAMIDFPDSLLALQGLTAGTYLGFKFPEK